MSEHSKPTPPTPPLALIIIAGWLADTAADRVSITSLPGNRWTITASFLRAHLPYIRNEHGQVFYHPLVDIDPSIPLKNNVSQPVDQLTDDNAFDELLTLTITTRPNGPGVTVYTHRSDTHPVPTELLTHFLNTAPPSPIDVDISHYAPEDIDPQPDPDVLTTLDEDLAARWVYPRYNDVFSERSLFAKMVARMVTHGWDVDINRELAFHHRAMKYMRHHHPYMKLTTSHLHDGQQPRPRTGIVLQAILARTRDDDGGLRTDPTSRPVIVVDELIRNDNDIATKIDTDAGLWTMLGPVNQATPHVFDPAQARWI